MYWLYRLMLEWLLPWQRALPLQWRIVGNSGAVKGIERAEGGSVCKFQDDGLKGPPHSRGETLQRGTGEGGQADRQDWPPGLSTELAQETMRKCLPSCRLTGGASRRGRGRRARVSFLENTLFWKKVRFQEPIIEGREWTWGPGHMTPLERRHRGIKTGAGTRRKPRNQ